MFLAITRPWSPIILTACVGICFQHPRRLREIDLVGRSPPVRDTAVGTCRSVHLQRVDRVPGAPATSSGSATPKASTRLTALLSRMHGPIELLVSMRSSAASPALALAPAQAGGLSLPSAARLSFHRCENILFKLA